MPFLLPKQQNKSTDGTGEDRNLKFGTDIDQNKSSVQIINNPQVGRAVLT